MSTYSFGGPADDTSFSASAPSFRMDTEQSNSPLSINNQDSADLLLARKQADEIINISGAEVKIYTRTNNADYDAVWDEDPDPTYWNAFGLKGFFKPAPLEVELKKWGADSVNKTEITFSHGQVYDKLGERMLRTGDVIRIPYNFATKALDPKNYRVVNAYPAGSFRYNWLYITCTIETLSADITVRPEADMIEDVPVQTGGQYRETI